MTLTYAIGDVHGRLDLLRRAFDAIEQHADGRSRSLVMLGDYIDRGPDSRLVVETLMGFQATPDVHCLKGNHETMMLDSFYARDRRTTKWWAGNGGEETIASYGGDYGWGKPSFWPLIPRAHIVWMERLPSHVEVAGRLFVHAGFRPHTALAEQQDADVLWIRDKFLHAPVAFQDWPYIVHGHTPVEVGKTPHEAYVLDWRCNLDSQAYKSGVLTVGVFGGDGGPPSKLIYVREHDHEIRHAAIQNQSEKT